MALGKNGRRLYVANVLGNSITVIDTQSMQPVKDVPVGERPYAVSLALNGTRAFVTNQYDGSISVYIQSHLR